MLRSMASLHLMHIVMSECVAWWRSG